MSKIIDFFIKTFIFHEKSFFIKNVKKSWIFRIVAGPQSFDKLFIFSNNPTEGRLTRPGIGF